MSDLKGAERSRYVQAMFGRIAGRYDLLNRLMTFAQDGRWRRRTVRRLDMPKNGRILDVGAGTGDLALEALKQNPHVQVFAADFTPEMVDVGRKRPGGDQIHWVIADALHLPFRKGSFEGVMSGFLLRNVSAVGRALAEQKRVLGARADGRDSLIVSLDTSPPKPGPLKPLIDLHFRTVIPLLGRVVAGDAEAYTYLPDSTRGFLSAGSLVEQMRQAGLERVEYALQMFGTVAIHWGSGARPQILLPSGASAEVDSARRGEPSYLWRDGQERRMKMILAGAGDRASGAVLDNGCGVGLYLEKLGAVSPGAVGLEYDAGRARLARDRGQPVVRAQAERLPFATGAFDLVLSHEVLEHVHDDQAAASEIARVLRSPVAANGNGGGRLVLFLPNRGYPFETHGVFINGRYRFGNYPLVNYLPRSWRDRLTPHVRVYSRRDVERLLRGLPLRVVKKTVIFGAYDNIIARWPTLGRALRGVLQALEATPLRGLGLSHLWVLEKTARHPDTQ